MRNALYADGGVIGGNPSEIGGTWAWRHVGLDGEINSGSGVIAPREAGLAVVTNNLTEMLAVLKGLQALPDGWQGVVYSDSNVTLGRVFRGWKWANIPTWVHDLYRQQVERLAWSSIDFVLLAGHPTAAQLAAGTGRHGYPVSEHNVWCDKACRRAGEHFLAEMETRTVKGLVPA